MDYRPPGSSVLGVPQACASRSAMSNSWRPHDKKQNKQPKNPYHWLTGLLTTEIYISQFWRLEVQNQGASGFRVWYLSASWFTDRHLFTVSKHIKKWGSSLVFFYKGTNPIHQSCTHNLITSQSPHLLASLHWALEFWDDINVHGTPLQYSCLENPMDGGAW